MRTYQSFPCLKCFEILVVQHSWWQIGNFLSSSFSFKKMLWWKHGLHEQKTLNLYHYTYCLHPFVRHVGHCIFILRNLWWCFLMLMDVKCLIFFEISQRCVVLLSNPKLVSCYLNSLLVLCSLWDYTNVVMNFLCRVETSSASFPCSYDWLENFDVVITGRFSSLSIYYQ